MECNVKYKIEYAPITGIPHAVCPICGSVKFKHQTIIRTRYTNGTWEQSTWEQCPTCGLDRELQEKIG